MKVVDFVLGLGEEKVVGKYRLIRELGRGGMGVVYLAEDTRLSRQVALKVLHPSLSLDTDFVARFAGEARSIAALTHPGIVRVHAFEEVGGCQLIDMEYVEGCSLDRYLQTRALDRATAMGIAFRVLDALAACHDRDMVHRDVKPSNILIGDDGRILLSDFGLARSCLMMSSASATASCFVGTPKYAAPESWTGTSPTPASDVYSAGLVLLEMLAGRTPYDGDSPLEILQKTVDSPVIPVRELVPDVSEPLGKLLEEMLHREPQRRPPNAGQALNRLRMVPEYLEVPGDMAQTLQIVPEMRPRPFQRSRVGSWTSILIGILALLMITLALWSRFHKDVAVDIPEPRSEHEESPPVTAGEETNTAGSSAADWTDPNANNLIAVGDYAVFIANAGNWRTLWSYDTRTETLMPLWPTLRLDESDDLHGTCVVAEGVVSVIRSDKYGVTLFSTDGTTEGTFPLAFAGHRAASRMEILAARNGKAWFNRIGGDHTFGLWETDGSLEGTRHVWGSAGNAIVDVMSITDKGTLYFGSSDSRTLYVIPVGAREPLLVPPNIEAERSRFGQAATLGERLFVEFRDVESGSELFVADARPDSLKKFREFVPGAAHGLQGAGFTQFGRGLVFSANTPEFGVEPWITDGTPEGTRMIKDINPGLDSSDPYRFCETNGRIFFSARTNTCGYELWVTDGTPAGTHMLGDLGEGQDSGNPYALLPFRNGLLFTPHETQHGEELWYTDGTPESTQLVFEFLPGPEGGEPYSPVLIDDRALFIARHPEYGRVLWETDGTEAGTRHLVERLAGEPAKHPPRPEWTHFQDKVYLSRYTPEYGVELWYTKRDNGELNLVSDVRPGPTGSMPHAFCPVGDYLYFAADDGMHGTELWRTDGTDAGTVLVFEANPGEGSGNPHDIVGDENGNLVFLAWSGEQMTVYAFDNKSKEFSPVPAPRPLPDPWAPVDLRQSGVSIYRFSVQNARGETTFWETNGRQMWRVRGLATGFTP